MNQLSLFHTNPPDKRAAWSARFDRVEWVAPWPTATGRPKGSVFLGYRCPDPDCGEVEPTAFGLVINHGFDPDLPGRQGSSGRCHKRKRPTNDMPEDGA